MTHYDVAIIGAGPAALAAAIAAHEAGAARICMLERDTDMGGILQQCIHNGFGLHYFGEELTGPEYAQRFIDMLPEKGIDIFMDTMVLSINERREIIASGPQTGVLHIQAGALVLAMGCRERTRGAINIPGTRPAGVFTAGSAQWLVNMQDTLPGRQIVILGSGDIGLIMARRLNWAGAEVKLVCELMPYSSGLTRNIVQCLDDQDIPLLYSHTVVRIHGRERVEGVTIAQVDEHLQPIESTYQYIPCDTLLLSVGLLPENELTRMAGVQMDPVTSGAVVDQHRQSSVPGIFACGNVLHVHDLVDNVSREAALAGAAAARFAAGQLGGGRQIRVRPGRGVSYVVPQRIDLDTLAADQEVELYLRVRDVYKPATLRVLDAQGAQLKRRRKSIMTPGEMQSIAITPGAQGGDLTVEVEGSPHD